MRRGVLGVPGRLGWTATFSICAHAAIALTALREPEHAEVVETAAPLLIDDVIDLGDGATSPAPVSSKVEAPVRAKAPRSRSSVPSNPRAPSASLTPRHEMAAMSGHLPVPAGGVATPAGAHATEAANGAGSESRGLGMSSSGKGKFSKGAGSLAHGPRLLTSNDPCRGLFPYRADDDAGSVTLDLVVSQSGRTVSSRVVNEHPDAQGFAVAARSCAPRLRFEPATDATGAPVASHSVVRLRFARN